MESWLGGGGGYTQPDLIVNQFRRKTADTFSVLPNFSSADWGPFMACKAEKGVLEAHFPGRGSGVRNMALPSLENLRAKFSEASFPHFKTCFMQISLLSLDNNRRLIPIIYSVFNVPFSKCVAQKKKSCVCFTTFPSYIYSFFL